MENMNTYKLHQTGPETQTLLDQVNENTTDIAQLQDLYQAFIGSGVTIIQPTDTWPVANPEEKVIYRVIDRVNTPPESYSDYMWNGTTMVLMATYDNAIDSTPTAGSNNPVASGGVLNYVSTNGSAYDISAANSGTAYADLAAALGTNGANVPAAVRKGGMSIKFVQSSDHKYVQARLMANAFTTDITKWQVVDDEPTAGSDNLVKSGGVWNIQNGILQPLTLWKQNKAIIRNDNKWQANSSAENFGIFIPCKGGESYKIKGNTASVVACVKEVGVIDGSPVEYATGASRIVIQNGNVIEGTIPSDAKYIYVSSFVNNTSWLPLSIIINGFDYIKGGYVEIKELKESVTKIVEVNLSDYTNLRNCFDSISPTEEVHYVVNIPEGEYDIKSYFTTEEIAASDFKGLFVPDYVTLRGIGRKEYTILKWYNEDNERSEEISTLNLRNVAGLENLTINSRNIRYSVHDDFAVYGRENIKICFNVDINHYSGVYNAAWGAGQKGEQDAKFINCNFYTDKNNKAFSSHNNVNVTRASFISFENCTFRNEGTFQALGFSSLNNGTTAITQVSLEGCSIDNGIRLIEENAAQYGAGIKYEIVGFGNNIDNEDVLIVNTDGLDYSSKINLLSNWDFINTPIVSHNKNVNDIIPAMFIGGVSEEIIQSVNSISVLKNVNGVYGLRLLAGNGDILFTYGTTDVLHSGVYQNREFVGYLNFDSIADGEYNFLCKLNAKDITNVDSFEPIRDYFAKNNPVTVSHTDVEHKFVNYDTGEIVGTSSTAANRTLPIKVSAGDTIYIGCTAGNAIAVVSLCSSTGTNIVPVVRGDARKSLYSYTIQDDGYIMCSYATPNPFMITIVPYKEDLLLNKTELYFGHNSLNNLVRYLYIPSTLISAETLGGVKYARVFNGFNGFYGMGLYNESMQTVLSINIGAADDELHVLSNGVILGLNWQDIDYTWRQYEVEEINVSLIQSKSRQPMLSALLNTKEIDSLKIQGNTYFDIFRLTPAISESAKSPLIYEGDNKVQSNHIVNAVTYPNGVIIAARAGGSIVRINLDGTEETLLTITGASDWRGLFIDKDLNVYASPHASVGSSGGFQMTDRGLYKLAYGEDSMTKVISLYDTNSSDTYETQQNDDTIWTMCQDHDGYLYAGVYCHTMRYAPRIYRSTDGGDTWSDYYDFLSILPDGHHVHTIIYNEYNNALYCIIGEVNTVLKSVDHGTTWTNLNAACEYEKGSSMIAVKDGVIIGSDGGFQLSISKLYADDKTVKTVARAWANTIFAIRKSDVTGWLYAFTKIDSSVTNLNWMPPMEAINDASVLAAWKAGTYGTMSAPPSQLSTWQRYNNMVKDYWPDDAIRPQHIGILVSKDNGETWEILYREATPSSGTSGFVTTGYFRNGECLTGRFNNGVLKPLIITENRHKFTTSGIDLSGEIFIRTNNSVYV